MWYVREEKPHIIGITETWGNSKIENSEISFDGYQTFRKDRKDRIGGGVLLYIRNDIKAVHREIFENIDAETIWCEIFIGEEGTLIGVSYRSPMSSVEEDKILFQMIGNASGKKLMLMGDFNFGNINWITHEACGQSKNFLDCINDNFLHQHVHQITRGKNILDLVFTSEEHMIEELNVGEPFGTSDHQIIRCKLIVSKCNEIPDSKPLLNYFKADYNAIREKLKADDLFGEIREKNIEEFWNFLKSKIEEIKDKFIPVRQKLRGKCSWSTRETTKCRRAKVKAWTKFCKLRSDDAYQKYKLKLNKATAANKNAQRNFEKKLATYIKDNNKSFFAYVRSKQRTRDKVGPLKDKNDKIIVDDQQGADLLNDYFSSVFTKKILKMYLNQTRNSKEMRMKNLLT